MWVIETATGKSRALFPDKRNVKSLAWSPDGSRLLCSVDSYQYALEGIYSIGVDGTGLTRLTHSP